MKKKWYFWAVPAAVLVLLASALILHKTTPALDRILDEKGYTIIAQEETPVSLSIPNAILKEAVYAPEGEEFGEEEVLVHATKTSSVFLRKIVPSNESDTLLYFVFDIVHDCPDSGELLLPYSKNEDGSTLVSSNLHSDTLTTETQTFEHAISFRGQGPECKFAYYVSADVCRAAEGTLQIDAALNCLKYEKN